MSNYVVDDRLLAALIKQESGGKHNAVSSKGARGITQVMPKTGQNPGFGVTPLRDSTEQEYKRFTRDYLGAMLDRYNGHIPSALAAYNAGPGAVDKAGGVPKYKETQGYVKNIMRMINPIKDANAAEDDRGMQGQKKQDIELSPEDEAAYQAYLRGEDTQQLEQPAQDITLSPEDESAYQAYLRGEEAPQPAQQEQGSTAAQLLGGIGAGVIDSGKSIAHLFGSDILDNASKRANEITDTTAGHVGKFGGQMAAMMVPGAAAGKVGLAGRLAADAAGNFAMTDGSLGDRAMSAGVGAGIGAAGSKLASMVTGGGIGGKLSAEGAKMMDEGIQPSVGQAYGGKLNAFEQKATSIPLVGDWIGDARNRAIGEKQLSMLAKAMPEGATVKPQNLNDLESAFNQAYDDALTGVTVTKARDIKNAAEKLKSLGFRTNLTGKTDVSGREFHKELSLLQAKVSKLKNTADDIDKVNKLDDAQGAIDVLRSKIADKTAVVDSKYGQYKTLEKAQEQSGPDVPISAAQLQKAVKAGAKYNGQSASAYAHGRARGQDDVAALRALGNNVPDSGTVGRGLVAGAGATATGLTVPSTIVPTIAALAAAKAGSTRTGQKFLTGGFKNAKVDESSRLLSSAALRAALAEQMRSK